MDYFQQPKNHCNCFAQLDMWSVATEQSAIGRSAMLSWAMVILCLKNREVV
jgi:hypothetical protein